jgi:hypothetical protein
MSQNEILNSAMISSTIHPMHILQKVVHLALCDTKLTSTAGHAKARI